MIRRVWCSSGHWIHNSAVFMYTPSQLSRSGRPPCPLSCTTFAFLEVHNSPHEVPGESLYYVVSLSGTLHNLRVQKPSARQINSGPSSGEDSRAKFSRCQLNPLPLTSIAKISSRPLHHLVHTPKTTTPSCLSFVPVKTNPRYVCITRFLMCVSYFRSSIAIHWVSCWLKHGVGPFHGSHMCHAALSVLRSHHKIHQAMSSLQWFKFNLPPSVSEIDRGVVSRVVAGFRAEASNGCNGMATLKHSHQCIRVPFLAIAILSPKLNDISPSMMSSFDSGQAMGSW